MDVIKHSLYASLVPQFGQKFGGFAVSGIFHPQLLQLLLGLGAPQLPQKFARLLLPQEQIQPASAVTVCVAAELSATATLSQAALSSFFSKAAIWSACSFSSL